MRRIVLLAALLLAGCSDPDQVSPEPDAVMSPSTTASPGPAPPTAVVSRPVTFSWSGHTKEGVWVCTEQSGAGQCPAGQQVAPDGQHVTTAAYTGDLTALDLTMSWQADPTQTGLVLAVYANRTGGPLALAQGASPLSLRIEAADLALPADDVLRLMVWPEGKTETSPSVFVDATQQAFTVDGTLWQTGAT